MYNLKIFLSLRCSEDVCMKFEGIWGEEAKIKIGTVRKKVLMQYFNILTAKVSKYFYFKNAEKM